MQSTSTSQNNRIPNSSLGDFGNAITGGSAHIPNNIDMNYEDSNYVVKTNNVFYNVSEKYASIYRIDKETLVENTTQSPLLLSDDVVKLIKYVNDGYVNNSENYAVMFITISSDNLNRKAVYSPNLFTENCKLINADGNSEFIDKNLNKTAFNKTFGVILDKVTYEKNKNENVFIRCFSDTKELLWKLDINIDKNDTKDYDIFENNNKDNNEYYIESDTEIGEEANKPKPNEPTPLTSCSYEISFNQYKQYLNLLITRSGETNIAYLSRNKKTKYNIRVTSQNDDGDSVIDAFIQSGLMSTSNGTYMIPIQVKSSNMTMSHDKQYIPVFKQNNNNSDDYLHLDATPINTNCAFNIYSDNLSITYNFSYVNDNSLFNSNFSFPEYALREDNTIRRARYTNLNYSTLELKSIGSNKSIFGTNDFSYFVKDNTDLYNISSINIPIEASNIESYVLLQIGTPDTYTYTFNNVKYNLNMGSYLISKNSEGKIVPENIIKKNNEDNIKLTLYNYYLQNNENTINSRNLYEKYKINLNIVKADISQTNNLQIITNNCLVIDPKTNNVKSGLSQNENSYYDFIQFAPNASIFIGEFSNQQLVKPIFTYSFLDINPPGKTSVNETKKIIYNKIQYTFTLSNDYTSGGTYKYILSRTITDVKDEEKENFSGILSFSIDSPYLYTTSFTDDLSKSSMYMQIRSTKELDPKDIKLECTTPNIKFYSVNDISYLSFSINNAKAPDSSSGGSSGENNNDSSGEITENVFMPNFEDIIMIENIAFEMMPDIKNGQTDAPKWKYSDVYIRGINTKLSLSYEDADRLINKLNSGFIEVSYIKDIINDTDVDKFIINKNFVRFIEKTPFDDTYMHDTEYNYSKVMIGDINRILILNYEDTETLLKSL